MEIISEKIYLDECDFIRYNISNSKNLKIILDSLGAAIREIKILKDDNYMCVTLAPTNDNDFHKKYNYHGKTIGRASGRIKNAQYKINEKIATLEKNNFNTDNLHSGSSCLAFKLFNSSIKVNKTYTDIIFTYTSLDLEGGHPETIKIKITYRVYEFKDKFKIIFEGCAPSFAYLNLTNHVYLNPNGDMSSIEDCILYLNASKVGKLNKNLIVEKIDDVNEEFNFKTPHKIKDYLYEKNVQQYTSGYDHPFFLDTKSKNDLASYIYSEKSNLKISIKTTYPTIVLYTNNYPTNYKIFNDKIDNLYLACCLECQFHPNGINENIKSNGTFFKKYHEETEYNFEFII